MPSEANTELVPALMMALVAALREARDAVAAQNLERLEAAVFRQQELASVIASHEGYIQSTAAEDPQLLIEFSRESAVLMRVMRRSNDTIRALLAIARDSIPLYTLESLPRR